MSKPILEVHNLTKRYRLGQIGAGSLKDELQTFFRKFRSRQEDPISAKSRELWALKDVSFDVEEGTILGVVGSNGAGKSTLLKILSRITEPTSGTAILRGKVASLLEVGTGFHPELSGRDNIYLSGAVLGMKKPEITRKFDEIVSFAEVERFIDTPVKRYSSGMTVRLGFAIAAHLDPEILIVDEVLAVGDVRFQEKCINKMKDIRSSGKTILFVSHNPIAIKLLCTRCIVLSGGLLTGDGIPSTIMSDYAKTTTAISGSITPEKHDENSPVRLNAISILQDGKATASPFIHKSIEVVIEFSVLNQIVNIHPNIHLQTADGNTVFSSLTWPNSFKTTGDNKLNINKPGTYKAKCIIPPDFLNTENFSVSVLFVSDTATTFGCYDAIIHFKTEEDLTMREAGFTGKWIGIIRPKLQWIIKDIS